MISMYTSQFYLKHRVSDKFMQSPSNKYKTKKTQSKRLKDKKEKTLSETNEGRETGIGKLG